MIHELMKTYRPDVGVSRLIYLMLTSATFGGSEALGIKEASLR